MNPSDPGPPRRPDLRLARAMAVLMSATLVGLGMWSLVTGTYSGHTSKLGGADVFLTGASALRAGAMTIALGLSPLAFCFRTPRQAGWWAGACMATFLGLLATLLYS